MPTHLEWLLEGYIIYESFDGIVTVDEIQRVSHEGVELLQTATRPLHFVIDTRQMTKTPNLIALRKVDFGHAEKNQGYTVQIAPKGIKQFLTSTLSQWLGRRIYFQDTFPEALALLAKLDPELPDLSTVTDPMTKSKA